MRFSPRVILTGIIFFAYLIGGLIAPVAHHHDHEQCCSHDLSSHCETESAQQSDSTCPFGHANCGHTKSSHSTATQESDPQSLPSSPCDDCAACRILYMASHSVEFVILPVSSSLITEVSHETSVRALLVDVAFPAQRGPPAC